MSQGSEARCPKCGSLKREVRGSQFSTFHQTTAVCDHPWHDEPTPADPASPDYSKRDMLHSEAHETMAATASPTPQTFDIVVYDEYGDGHWAQERFLVHGHDDVLWTSDIEGALNFLRESIEKGLDKGVDLT